MSKEQKREKEAYLKQAGIQDTPKWVNYRVTYLHYIS
jgi:hypothetical protein